MGGPCLGWHGDPTLDLERLGLGTPEKGRTRSQERRRHRWLGIAASCRGRHCLDHVRGAGQADSREG